MKNALFHNFTDKEFIGYWNGKSRTFAPGEKKMMPEYLARHFAKHLANQVLTKKGKDTACSPKFPEQVPEFMAEFNKAFQMEEQDELDDMDAAIELANAKPSSSITTKPREQKDKKPSVAASDELKTPVDDEDDESGFEAGEEKS